MEDVPGRINIYGQIGLVVVFAQRYVKSAGIGTVLSMMLPYSIVFLIAWTLFLLGYTALDLPLGLGASYSYQP